MIEEFKMINMIRIAFGSLKLIKKEISILLKWIHVISSSALYINAICSFLLIILGEIVSLCDY